MTECLYTDVVLAMCVQVVDSKLPRFCERVVSEFLDSNTYRSLRKQDQKERHVAVLRYILSRNEKVRRRDLSEEFVKDTFYPHTLTRIVENLTYAKFIDREEERTPVNVTGVYFRVHRDRIVLNDCLDDAPAVSRVVRVSDMLSITDELEDHVRDVRRVMNDLPPEEGELKAQLQDYLNRRRIGEREERKQKAKNLEKRREIKRR